MLTEGDPETKPARARLGFRQCIGKSYRIQDGAKANEQLGRGPRGETRKPTYDNGSGSQICGVVDEVRELRPDISLEAKYTVKRRHTLPNIETSACSSSIPARPTAADPVKSERNEDTSRSVLERPWYSMWSILGTWGSTVRRYVSYRAAVFVSGFRGDVTAAGGQIWVHST